MVALFSLGFALLSLFILSYTPFTLSQSYPPSPSIVGYGNLPPPGDQDNATQLLDRKIYFHIITPCDGTEPAASISTQTLKDQVKLLNKSWAEFNITFTEQTDQHQNDSWFNAAIGSQAEREMKSALHNGSYADLNIYITNLNETNCTKPVMYPEPEDKLQDGCRVSWREITSGRCDYYMKGILPSWFQLELVYGETNSDCVDPTDAGKVCLTPSPSLSGSSEDLFPYANITTSLCGLMNATLSAASNISVSADNCTLIQAPITPYEDVTANGEWSGVLCLRWPSSTPGTIENHCMIRPIMCTNDDVMNRLYSSLLMYRVFSTDEDGYACLLDVPFFDYQKKAGFTRRGAHGKGRLEVIQDDGKFVSGFTELSTESLARRTSPCHIY